MKIKDCNKKIKNMFPEFSNLIARLREDNPHFAYIFEQHEQLDREVAQLELNPVNLLHNEIEQLKRRKLRLKDQMYHMLQQAHLQQS
jgi:uncharacterized protein